MHERAAALIRELALQPHPEGGHYRQTYRSPSTVTREADADRRAALTAIYFLLTAGEISRWHRVASDEIWTHLEGGAIRLWFHDEGRTEARQLAPLAAGGSPFLVVPAQTWQAAECEGDYALVACFVAPGFDFADFVLMSDDSAAHDALQATHPKLLHLI
ncbi:MAG TPA: cupin domain-containing protein [Thermoanaerobaculia bacterium]|nr:cupin domain-containing protein [Thermoanaerobaculia bacterium]